MYKEDLALHNLQRLICHKTQPNQTKSNPLYTNILNIHDLVWFGFKASQPLLVI